MGSSTSSFLYLPYAEKLADIKKAGIDLDVVERIVVKKKTNEEVAFKQTMNFIEDTSCRGCGGKVESLDVVVLDSVFYLWHNRCYQETGEHAKEVGTYNEVSSRFGVFRRGTEGQVHCLTATKRDMVPVPLSHSP
ncbi:hypothetical protein [Mesobacillus maritimus]|uniref:hypothetical protein n=1 Tax=Mesobacillus maritimus TaxID=1643336 RepID=UPI00384ADD1A